MNLLSLFRGLRCPRCGVDLEDQWDYDEHLEMHVEADRNKEGSNIARSGWFASEAEIDQFAIKIPLL
ncbi:hypothetical protein Tco_1288103 [Tanacetum coccineum]